MASPKPEEAPVIKTQRPRNNIGVMLGGFLVPRDPSGQRNPQTPTISVVQVRVWGGLSAP